MRYIILFTILLASTICFADIVAKNPNGTWSRTTESYTRKQLVDERQKISEDIDDMKARCDEKVAALRLKKEAIVNEIYTVDSWVDPVVDPVVYP